MKEVIMKGVVTKERGAVSGALHLEPHSGGKGLTRWRKIAEEIVEVTNLGC
jgi:hypothetical protein